MIGAVVGVRAQGSPRPPAPEIAGPGRSRRACSRPRARPRPNGLARIERRRIPLRWARTARGEGIALRRARITQAVPTPSRMSPLAWWHRGAPGRWSGVRGRAHQEGYSAGSWRCSPAWTTCVPLDHLNAVGPPGSRNTVVQRNASGPTARKWSKQTEGVTTCETPSHHAGRAVGAERERGRRNRPRSTRSAPDDRPADPVAPDSPRRARRRPGRAITTGPAPQLP